MADLGSFGLDIPAEKTLKLGRRGATDLARMSVRKVAAEFGYALRDDTEVVETLDDGSIRYWIKGDIEHDEHDD